MTASARSGVPISKTMSSAGPGAPPCSGPLSAPTRAGDRGDDVGARGDDHPGRKRGRVEAVIADRVQVGFQGAGALRRRFGAGQLMEVVGGVREIGAHGNRRLALRIRQ